MNRFIRLAIIVAFMGLGAKKSSAYSTKAALLKDFQKYCSCHQVDEVNIKDGDGSQRALQGIYKQCLDKVIEHKSKGKNPRKDKESLIGLDGTERNIVCSGKDNRKAKALLKTRVKSSASIECYDTKKYPTVRERAKCIQDKNSVLYTTKPVYSQVGGLKINMVENDKAKNDQRYPGEKLASASERYRKRLNRLNKKYCSCERMQSPTENASCLENAVKIDAAEVKNFKNARGTTLCSANETATTNKNQKEDPKLAYCLKHYSGKKCLKKLDTRLKQLYCWDNESQCADLLINYTAGKGLKRFNDTCVDDKGELIPYKGITDVKECQHVAAAQYLVDIHSSNLLDVYCPIQNCKSADDKSCDYKERIECTKKVLNGYVLTETELTEVTQTCESKMASKEHLKQYDGCINVELQNRLQLSGADISIAVDCVKQYAKKDASGEKASDANLMKAVKCYTNKAAGINTNIKKLEDEIKAKYCQQPNMKISADDCMRLLYEMALSDVSGCNDIKDPAEQKVCLLKKALARLQNENFPITSCFDKKKYATGEETDKCLTDAKKITAAMEACAKMPAGEQQVQCFAKVKTDFPELYDEYIAALEHWNKVDFSECASLTPETEIDKCKIEKLSQKNALGNTNPIVLRNKECMTDIDPNKCVDQNKKIVGTDHLKGSRGTIDLSSGAGGGGAAGLGSLGAVAGVGGMGGFLNTLVKEKGEGDTLSSSAGQITLDNGETVSLDSSALGGTQDSGMMGVIKDFGYLKFLKHPNPTCKALGKSALLRVTGTVGGLATMYFVNKAVKDKIDKKKEDGSLKQSDFFSGLQSTLAGAASGLVVKFGFNQIANIVVKDAIKDEAASIAAGHPPTPTKCSSPKTVVNHDEFGKWLDSFEKNQYDKVYITRLEQADSELDMQKIYQEWSYFNQTENFLSPTEDELDKLIGEDEMLVLEDKSLAKDIYKTLISGVSSLSIISSAYAQESQNSEEKKGMLDDISPEKLMEIFSQMNEMGLFEKKKKEGAEEEKTANNDQGEEIQKDLSETQESIDVLTALGDQEQEINKTIEKEIKPGQKEIDNRKRFLAEYEQKVSGDQKDKK